MSFKRTIVASGFVILVATACFPQGNIAHRMPLMATWTDNGDLEVVFPLCEGQALANMGLTGETDGTWWTLRQGDPNAAAPEDEIVSLVIGKANLVEGSLSERWPVIRAFELGHPTDIRKFDYVFVKTTRYAAGIDIVDIIEGESWVIDGDTVDHQTSPVAVTHTDGMAQIGGFCDSQ